MYTKDYKVSFIVPIYNVEVYLSKCLDSISKQTYSNIEVLMVNDGATDSSREIAKHFSDIDSRFILIDRENGGLSAARNTGLSRVSGQAVVFVDSDDFIEPEYTELCVNRLRETDSDMVCCRLQYDNPFTSKKHTYGHDLPTEILTKDDIIVNAFLVKDIHTPVWAKVYNTEFLIKHSLKFYEGIVNEDTLFTSQVSMHARRVAFVNRSLYHSMERPGSISRSSQDRLIADMEKALSLVRKYMEQHGIWQKDKFRQAYYTRYIRSFLYNLLQAVQRLPFDDFKTIHHQCVTTTNYLKYGYEAKMLTLPYRMMYNLSKQPALFKIVFKCISIFGFKMH